jgi:transposase
MTRSYSEDLRERVVGSLALGRTCRETAALFGVSVASVVKWSQRLRATGNVAASPMGSRMALSLLSERDWLLARIAASPDVTLRELVVELGERGCTTSYGSVWRLFAAEGISFKKNRARQRAGSARRRTQAGTLEEAPEPV